MDDKKQIADIINEAFKAQEFAYAPYSKFKVGAALLAKDNLIIKGCNVENSAYPVGSCAERTAIVKAISEGITDFKAIAIVAFGDDKKPVYASPCGMCRQLMREFVNPKEFIIIMAKSEDDYKIMTLEELLPMSFGPTNLNMEEEHEKY